MTEPSLVAQTITISHNIAIAAASCFVFAGFVIGYAIAWRQRSSEPPARDEVGAYDIGGPVDLDELRRLRDGAEDRVRRSQA